ncbi:MAG: right-handed parallel beta-helix repeat-containing protein, partial [Candidatus Coproplasma sp.]
MKKRTFKKYNSVLLTGILSTVLAVGAIGATTTMVGTKSDFSARAYESRYEIDSEKIGTGKTYYVAPDGTSENTENSSPENRANLAYLLLHSDEILKPGDKVLVAPGTYYINQAIRAYASGDTTGYISVMNEDPTQKAVLNFSGQTFDGNNRGVQIDGDFWYWYGVDICGAGDNGMYIGGSYNVIENCEFYNNRDTGLQLGRSYGDYANITQWPSYNLIKNCTSYNNYDNETYGENADGFAAKLTVGYGNIFDGCIAYRNSDDGWDLYAKADSGNIGAVIMYNCVAFENGYLGETQEAFNAKCGYTNANGEWVSTYNTKYDEPVTNSYTTRDGDGNGFKLGGSIMEGDVFLYNCMSFNNRMHGITDNSNPGVLS